MANSKCISEWKQQILSDLQNDNMILKVLDVTEEEIEREGLLYNRLYPMTYIVDTQDIVKTYICVEVSIDKNADSRFRSTAFVRPVITFRIIGHQDDFKVRSFPTFKTKLDYLSELIDEKYNGKSISGSAELELVSNVALDITNTYRERVVRFRCVELDNSVCK